MKARNPPVRRSGTALELLNLRSVRHSRPGVPIEFARLCHIRGEDGQLLITPGCTSFEEIEGQINSLQDELDDLRDRSRRAFQTA